MAKVKTIETRERDEPDEKTVDPVVLNLREFVYEGGPLSEDVKALEYRIRVQQMDRRGRAVQGVALETTEVEGLFENILEECGGGRYLLWINYRHPGDKEWKLLKVKDIELADPEAPPGFSSPPVAALPSSGEGRRDIIEVMLAQMAQTTRMMLASQDSNTKLLVAMLDSRRGGGGGETRDLLEAIRLGADLHGGGEGDDGPEDSKTSLIRLGMKVIDLLGGGGDEPVPRETLRKAAVDEGLDPAKLLEGQGLEHVSGNGNH